MNILSTSDEIFYKKISGLEDAKLDHALQQLEDELVRYKRLCQNYPPDRMEKCGVPFMERIQGRIDFVKKRKMNHVR